MTQESRVMFTSLRSILALLLSHGLLVVGNGMANILLAFRSRHEAFSTELTGVIMAALFAGMFAGALYAHKIISRVGHIRAFSAFASIASVVILAHLLFINPLAWIVFRTISGFCLAGMFIVVESWVNGKATNETRGRLLSVYMMTNFVGAALGQFMLIIGDPTEYELFVISSMIFSMALVPILLTGASAPAPAPLKRLPLKEVYRISPIGVIGSVFCGLTNASVNTMTAVFATDVGLTVTQIAVVTATVVAGGALLQYPVGRLSDRFDRRTVLLFTSAATFFASGFVLWATTQSFEMLVLSNLVFGGFCFCILPLVSAQANDRAQPEQLVQISAALLIAYGIGAIAGPILTAVIMGQIGPTGLYWMVMVIQIILIGFVGFRMAVRVRDADGKTEYMPLGAVNLGNRQMYSQNAQAQKSATTEPAKDGAK